MQEKNEAPLFWLEVTFEWYEYVVAFCVFIFIFYFLFRNNVKRAIGWKRVPSLLCFFPEGIIPKVLDHSYVHSSLSIITRQLDNSIWKAPYNWIFYGHRCQACTKLFNLLLYASLSQTSLVFKFNLLLIEWFLPQFIYLSAFLILYVEVYPVPLRSFHKSQ